MVEPDEALTVRSHGPAGRPVFVLHGGPGAPGYAAGLARCLADPLHVLEPWQRRSGATPLTVERHVEDLAEVLASHSRARAPALVGESWGAMLALAFAAKYPDRVAAILLVGCGTFDAAARARLHATLDARATPELRAELAALEQRYPDAAERFSAAHRLSDPLYTYCRAPDADDDGDTFDLKGHLESWNDMLRLQGEGRYPAAFGAIDRPVRMLHGDYDPHPGTLVRDSLVPYLPQLEYVELERCGHSPWLEVYARDRFRAEARSWLEHHVP